MYFTDITNEELKMFHKEIKSNYSINPLEWDMSILRNYIYEPYIITGLEDEDTDLVSVVPLFYFDTVNTENENDIIHRGGQQVIMNCPDDDYGTVRNKVHFKTEMLEDLNTVYVKDNNIVKGIVFDNISKNILSDVNVEVRVYNGSNRFVKSFKGVTCESGAFHIILDNNYDAPNYFYVLLNDDVKFLNGERVVE